MSFPFNITNPGIFIDGLLTSAERQFVTDLYTAGGLASEDDVLTWKSGAPSWEPNAGSGGYTNLTQFVDQTAWRLFYSNASGDVTELALGSSGTYLQSNGASSAPTWATPAGTVDGSGTTNEIAYWVDSNTLGALAVATYPSLTQLSYVKGVTSAIQTQIDGKAATVHTHTVSQISDLTATAAELNILDGATLSVTELNYVDGVTSAIQTQLDGKQASDAQLTSLAGLAYTGNALKVVRVNAGETDFELATVSGGSGSLDDAYNNGSTVTVDTDSVVLTVPAAANNVGLTINQLDTTNFPAAFVLNGQTSTTPAMVSSSTIMQINDENGNLSDWAFNVAGGGYPVINLQSTGGTLATPLETSSYWLSSIRSLFYDANNVQNTGSMIESTLESSGIGNEDVSLYLKTMRNGSMTTIAQLGYFGENYLYGEGHILKSSTDNTTGQYLVLWNQSATPAANDVVAYIDFQGADSGAGANDYARIKGIIVDPTATSEDGKLVFNVITAGTNADELELTGSALYPTTNDGLALGDTTHQYSDLFLAEGGVINWDNGDATLTQSGNDLTLAGASLTARVKPRTGTTTSSATPTINTDNVDEYYITAQAEAITSMTTNLSGTPTLGQGLFISIIGTAARAVTWGASFANGPVALPTTTVTTTQLSTFFKWDGSVWRCYATGSTV